MHGYSPPAILRTPKLKPELELPSISAAHRATPPVLLPFLYNRHHYHRYLHCRRHRHRHRRRHRHRHGRPSPQGASNRWVGRIRGCAKFRSCSWSIPSHHRRGRPALQGASKHLVGESEGVQSVDNVIGQYLRRRSGEADPCTHRSPPGK